MTATATFTILDYLRTLQENGVPANQAEAQSKALTQLFSAYQEHNDAKEKEKERENKEFERKIIAFDVRYDDLATKGELKTMRLELMLEI